MSRTGAEGVALLAMELLSGLRPLAEHRDLLGELFARRRPDPVLAGVWRCRRVTVADQDPRLLVVNAVMEDRCTGRVVALSVLVSQGRIVAADVPQPAERSAGWQGMSTVRVSG